jgi:hypothetical protein
MFEAPSPGRPHHYLLTKLVASFGTFSVERNFSVDTALLYPFGYQSLNSGLSSVILSQGVTTPYYTILVGTNLSLLFVLN